MKNFLLINNDLFNNFWVKAIETAKYFWNCLSIRIENYEGLILEKNWNNKHQNVSYIKIFGSKILMDILKEKRNKSDY